MLSSCSSSIRFASQDNDTIYNSNTKHETIIGKERGIASYYADGYHGKITSSGEIFDNRKMTAAHNTLSFGTIVNVRNISNNKEVIVRINDRGPFVKGRIIDLSRAAAEKLEMIEKGIIEVEIEIINE